MVISVRDVHKTYGKVMAVRGISFDVGAAACVGLLGPNGAGKSTLMKMIYGKSIRDERPGSAISVFGYDPMYDELRIKSICGVVPQEDNLDVELNVVENLMTFCKFYGIRGSAALNRIEELLDIMELSDKRDARLKSLSGGMKRRLIIARALINNPRLLILDEPTTGLDPQVRHFLWNKLRQMKKDNLTILLTTHYMEEAFQLCDDLIIINEGQKVIQGNPNDLLQRHIERYVLELRQSQAVRDLNGHAGSLNLRVDHAHGTTHVYSNSMDPLQDIIKTLNSDQYYLRQANLEDLFLKTTGRSLNETQ
ncbi:Nod factor export ATP-binding protein I [Candidatus Magnetobacterium bavaricum]|uniref:Nod factor export ATP-binding protein I n=1 Tax=Candidatus Magnetobacterium bavaricum TaxID=29290 RepID=A0A0F3GWY8_9BACT|nr:Nod factor export ATP-binding protein I [Candidatus Magnetobacterium bavaricum]